MALTQIFIYLQLLDLLTTLVGFKLGASEASPFIRMLMHAGPAAGVMASKLVALGLGAICVHRKKLRLIKWASQTGEATAKLVDSILSGLVHPQQGFNSCLGVISLSKKYGDDRVEAASKRALAIGGVSYKSMKSILVNGLDSKPLPEEVPAKEPMQHSNIRGNSYYN